VRSGVPLRGNGIQKFSFGSRPGDIWEREADRASTSVAAGKSAGKFSRATTGDLPAVPSVVGEVLKSPGRPLAAATRAFMEPRFGHDFSGVRVHSDERAAESARAVSALAYTVGNHIVFGAGQHDLSARHGQGLLAHELVHVVQQEGEQTSAGPRTAQPGPSFPPAGRIFRKASRDEEKKQQETVSKHHAQQRNIVGFVDAARKIRPDPKKGTRDRDNLSHNTVEMLDAGSFTLTVLSPTHYSPDRHFDNRYKHPKIGGDYPADRAVGGPGIYLEPNPPAGKIYIPKPPLTYQIETFPKKTEQTPGAPPAKPEKKEPTPGKVTAPASGPAPFSPSDIYLFTRGLDIAQDDFWNTFVHEAQHVADLSPKRLSASSAAELLESYKSEFRAFWIQPPSRTGPPARPVIDRLPEPEAKPNNSEKVTIADPARCTLCPPPAATGTPDKKTSSEAATQMKNARQEAIARHILAEYRPQQYDCCYVHNKDFRTGVNDFAFPESLNLINSERLMRLNLALQKLKPTMTKQEAGPTDFSAALQKLDALDWAFLNDAATSKLFWTQLKANAPSFLVALAKDLAKKAKTSP
jgi:hypothetical protein